MASDAGDERAGTPNTVAGYRWWGPLEEDPVPSGFRRYVAARPGGAPVGLTVALPEPDGTVSEERRGRLRTAVETAELAHHPWLLRVDDAGPADDLPWLATGHPGAPSVATVAARGGHLSEAALRLLGARLAAALGALHAAGRPHGAVGPHTVLLTADGPLLAGWVERGGSATEHDDVRGLATVLTTAAGGANPIAGGSTAVGLPPDLARLLDGCRADDPADRPSLDALRRGLVGGADGSAGEPTPTPAVWAALLPPLVSALVRRPDGSPPVPATPPAPAAPPEPAVPGRWGGPGAPPAALGTDRRADPSGGAGPPPVPSQPPAPEVQRAAIPPPPARPPLPTGSTPAAPASVPLPATPAQAAAPDDDEPTSFPLAPPQPAVPPVADAPEGGGTGRRRPPRRALLAAVGAGLVGTLTGAAAVGGWVVGRGGGTRALTAPYPVDGTPEPAEAGPPAPPDGAPPGALWRYDLASDPGIFPAVWEDRVLVIAGSSGTAGVEVATGEELWLRPDLAVMGEFDGRVRPVPHGDLVVLNDIGGVKGIDPETGAERWAEHRYQIGDPDFLGRTVVAIDRSVDDGRAVVLRTRPGSDSEADLGVALYDTEEGEERWHVDLPGAGTVVSYPVTDEASLLFSVARDDGIRLVELRLDDGETLRDDPLDEVEFTVLGLHSDDVGLVAFRDDGIAAVDLDSLEPRWFTPLEWPEVQSDGFVSRRVTWDGEDRDILAVSWEDAVVRAFDLADGAELWRRALPHRAPGSGARHLDIGPSGTELTLGTASMMTALDLRTGEPLWAFASAEGPADRYYSVPSAEVTIVWDGETAFGMPVREATDET